MRGRLHYLVYSFVILALDLFVLPTIVFLNKSKRGSYQL